MNTKVWTVDAKGDLSTNYPQITQAAMLLRDNETVAFPTETVYGLGANAKNTDAVAKIYEAKGRPSDNPLIVHIADISQLNEFAEVDSEKAKTLMELFWPGPLTIVLPCREGALSTRVTAGLATVAVRMPDHLVALELIKRAGVPVAAPSANVSGKPSPTKAEHVVHDLNGRIAGIVDGGPTGVGVESTVVSFTRGMPVILRPGGVTKEQLETAVGPVLIDQGITDEKKAPLAPGMKYTHYAPEAPLAIVKGSPEDIQRLIEQYRKDGMKVGVLTTEERASAYQADAVRVCGRRDRLETVASGLYDALRSFDECGLDFIFAESFPEEGVGRAVMNRLMKAAGHRVIEA
ncbi:MULTISPECIES: L-threonylcarbamoyladenylate synthase [Bacillus]|uniref:L-threonylcarbamoyladenylate synthase n=1 Tax=Bacillus TaxID=1386 RepID=UPI00158321F6|nr:L-threonylcarbamoyladenylate synthase [Bacillus glycinifermentans]MBU8787638.1 threonylcarbamoyl-AMP synthase [Bacillus glycinifermentans]NUJ17880.1 threonylcarbamoyl-AMP synthase [Bacillus glycinifermentans]